MMGQLELSSLVLVLESMTEELGPNSLELELVRKMGQLGLSS